MTLCAARIKTLDFAFHAVGESESTLSGKVPSA